MCVVFSMRGERVSVWTRWRWSANRKEQRAVEPFALHAHVGYTHRYVVVCEEAYKSGFLAVNVTIVCCERGCDGASTDTYANPASRPQLRSLARSRQHGAICIVRCALCIARDLSTSEEPLTGCSQRGRLRESVARARNSSDARVRAQQAKLLCFSAVGLHRPPALTSEVCADATVVARGFNGALHGSRAGQDWRQEGREAGRGQRVMQGRGRQMSLRDNPLLVGN